MIASIKLKLSTGKEIELTQAENDELKAYYNPNWWYAQYPQFPSPQREFWYTPSVTCSGTKSIDCNTKPTSVSFL